jgi:3-hydroxymyristoyl/3-hydroxydecanoyl-(acyl carrier protein) dehydratase
MIEAILGDRPQLARAAHVARQDAVSQILRLLAHLVAEGIPVNLETLYQTKDDQFTSSEPAANTGLVVTVPVGQIPMAITPRQPDLPTTPASAVFASVMPTIEQLVASQLPVIQAQAAFLRVNERYMESMTGLVRFQTQLLLAMGKQPGSLTLPALPRWESDAAPSVTAPPRALSYEQCCTYAVGKIADVLGPRYSEIDQFPTRVRLPDGPLQLVDRIIDIEGEPLSMTRGRVVTEHTVRPDRWYLEANRIPTALSVEAGQADLFLSGYLGIDLQTRGLAVYRLLDAVVTFHRGLPTVGETIRYDIHIDRFTKQGEVWLFHFRFDGTVNGEPFITMRNGVAGFFTAAALAAGKGIVQTALDRKALPGKRPADWRELVPQHQTTLTATQVDALRSGDLVTAFGADFAGLPLRNPVTLPGGMLRLIDRVPLLDPNGGRFGIGFVRGEFDIHPDDWFLKCHFIDDQVMPGTLMYECCLHTLRVLLLRIGWVGDAGEVSYEPVPGVESRLKCRGQVIASTRTVTYEVTVKEIGYRPEPYCLADALMYADGKPIVEITNMSTRLVGLTRERLESLWERPDTPVVVHEKRQRPRVYDSASILAFSNGKPSEAFGEPYQVFDSERVIARLPGPPFQFLDCVTDVQGEPFVLQAGASCVAEYTVPPDAWYFEANRCRLMPFAVLLEIALQPCGWLAAYCGSALTSTEDLSFRNLGGQATQLRAVTPETGTLTTQVKLTNVSRSAGMIIQHFEMRVKDRVGTVYDGTTYFGFFTKGQLAHQVGIRDAKVPWPDAVAIDTTQPLELPHSSPFPAPMLRMVDRIRVFPTAGRAGLGLLIGTIPVDPEAWFFKAHFYQDPVWPGSLGLESFLQLLKFAAWQRWGPRPERPWQTVALNQKHQWLYRGQVLPTDREVTIVLELTQADDHNQRLAANGFLLVDGRVIYQMTDFTLQ